LPPAQGTPILRVCPANRVAVSARSILSSPFHRSGPLGWCFPHSSLISAVHRKAADRRSLSQ
jgi:hypothetical protein